MARTLAFLGPSGTYTEEAALLYDPDAELRPYPNISAVGQAVAAGETEQGVAPIENSIEGSVNFTLDLLVSQTSLLIGYEIVIPIEHFLMGKPGTRLDEVQVVYSHPQALAQCREYLERNFTNAERSASLSTAQAVGDAMSSVAPAVAIAPRRSAALYDAEILASGIQDVAANATRFVVLSKSDHPPTGNDKTSSGLHLRSGLAGAVVRCYGRVRPERNQLGENRVPAHQAISRTVRILHRLRRTPGRPADARGNRGYQKTGEFLARAGIIPEVDAHRRRGRVSLAFVSFRLIVPKKGNRSSPVLLRYRAPHHTTTSTSPGAVGEGRLGRASQSPRRWNAPTGGSEAQGTEAPDRQSEHRRSVCPEQPASCLWL